MIVFLQKNRVWALPEAFVIQRQNWRDKQNDKSEFDEVVIWQTIVFVELIVIHVGSKQNKTARGVKRLKAMCFGANVIYINVIHKKIKNIAENALNFLVTH